MKAVIVNTVAVIILVAIITAIAVYICKQKKRGVGCIGCPYAKQCGGKSCGCGGKTEPK